MQVIQGKKQVSTKHSLYLEAWIRFADKKLDKLLVKENERVEEDLLAQYVYLGVKVIQTMRVDKDTVTREYSKSAFQIAGSVLCAIGFLTPRKLMQLFPIDKKYDGERYETKDYFYTLEKLKEHGFDVPIGKDEEIITFLWDYENHTIRMFLVQYMKIVGWERQYRGEQDPFIEFLEKEGIPTYTLHEKDGYIVNNITGECRKISKPKKRIPKQFKVL